MTAQHRRPKPVHRGRRAIAAFAVLGILSLGASSPAFAAKGGDGKPAHITSSSSLKLVLLDSTDGVPHWGQRVTFDVSSTATTQPNVSMKCYQNGVLVLTTQAGFYDGYPWPWTQITTLSTGAWTAGAADCHAVSYHFVGTKTVYETTLAFDVSA